MSFSVGEIGIVITIGKLLYKLQQDYASAPAEGANLANDLQHLQNCVASLQRSTPRSASDRKRLEAVLKPVLHLLGEIDEVSDRYSDLKSGGRIWDRITFPKVKIQALQKQIHLRISGLTLFMHSLQNNTLIRIEEILEDIGGVPSQRFSNVNGWEPILADLERRGISREAALRYKEPIEQHLVALSEVEEAESQLEVYENTTIMPEDAVDQDITVGPPTEADLASLVCAGATALQNGKQDVIKQSKSLLLRHFGACKYEIICRQCSFHGFQDEPLKSNDKPFNTPLFFAPRREAPNPSSMEYYLDIQRANRTTRDGIWYRTIFFWKCHIKSREPLLHTSASYQCVFCPPESAYGDTYSKDSLLEHIRRHHIQTPPPVELRKKFNVWIDNKPALFHKDEERLKLHPFDIMIPRAYGRTDRMRAEHAMRQAQVEEEASARQELEKSASDAVSFNSSTTAGVRSHEDDLARDIARTSTPTPSEVREAQYDEVGYEDFTPPKVVRDKPSPEQPSSSTTRPRRVAPTPEVAKKQSHSGPVPSATQPVLSKNELRELAEDARIAVQRDEEIARKLQEKEYQRDRKYRRTNPPPKTTLPSSPTTPPPNQPDGLRGPRNIQKARSSSALTKPSSNPPSGEHRQKLSLSSSSGDMRLDVDLYGAEDSGSARRRAQRKRLGIDYPVAGLEVLDGEQGKKSRDR